MTNLSVGNYGESLTFQLCEISNSGRMSQIKFSLVIGLLLLSSTVPGIHGRITCYTDVCTSPNQFCNDEDRRCNYCTVDVCQQWKNIPEECSKTCQDFLFPPTTTTAQPVMEKKILEEITELRGDIHNQKTLHLVSIGLSAAVITFLMVTAILLTVICLNKRKSRQKSQVHAVEHGEVYISNHEPGSNTEKIPLLNLGGLNPIQATTATSQTTDSPPSYTTSPISQHPMDQPWIPAQIIGEIPASPTGQGAEAASLNHHDYATSDLNEKQHSGGLDSADLQIPENLGSHMAKAPERMVDLDRTNVKNSLQQSD